MVGSWASWSLILSGGALAVAGAMLPFLPMTLDAFLWEDAFEDPGLLLLALGALAGRQRLWPLATIGALLLLAVDIGWRFMVGGAAFHVAFMAGAVLVAAWAAWPMRDARFPVAVSQGILVLATLAWLVHGTFLALGDPWPTTLWAGSALLVALGATLVLRGLALRRAAAGSPTLL